LALRACVTTRDMKCGVLSQLSRGVMKTGLEWLEWLSVGVSS
jgi:hypothetical protein